MSSSVANLVVRIPLDENLIGLDMLTLSFAVPVLFFMCFFGCILRQWDQFSSFFTMFSFAHILRISFFCEKIKHDTRKIKKLEER